MLSWLQVAELDPTTGKQTGTFAVASSRCLRTLPAVASWGRRRSARNLIVLGQRVAGTVRHPQLQLVDATNLAAPVVLDTLLITGNGNTTVLAIAPIDPADPYRITFTQNGTVFR